MDEKITELTTGVPVDTDWTVFVDVSDTTMGPDGTTKKAYKSDLKGADGTDGTDGTDGISFIWKGAYSAGTTYAPNDAVEYNGSSYMCKLASTGNAPTNTTYFDLMAQKGADGAGSGDVTANGTLTADKIILGDGLKVVKTSSKGIVTTLGTDDTSVPTSKAVKDVTDAKALLAGSTSQAFSVSQLEIGHASDTTLTRASAGVAAIEGSNIVTEGAGTAPSTNALKSATTTVNVSSATAPTSGQVLTATSSTAATWQTPSAGGSFVGCRLTKSTTQNISGTSLTAITFDTEAFDTSSFHDNSTNNTRITIPTTGYYMLLGVVTTDGNAGTWGGFRVDGTTYIHKSGSGNVTTNTANGIDMTAIYYFTANQYVEIIATFGTTQDAKSGTDGCSFSAYKIG